MRLVTPAVFAAALALAGTAQAKSLVFCAEASPENFGPMLATTSTSDTAAARAIYNRLFEFELGTTNLQPALAESYELSADGRVYTLKLRRGVKFQTTPYFKPTREMNADDVLFTFNRQWKKDHPYYAVNGGKYSHFASLNMAETLQSVEKVDDHTVRITINEAQSPFITNLGMNFLSIHSAEYAEQLLKAGTPEKIDLEPVGTGPFILVNYRRDVAINYRANPDYWRPRAKLDELTFVIAPDAWVRLAKLQTNECQVMNLPNPADVEAIEKNPALKVERQEGLNVGYLALNTEKKPLDDRRVRQALNLAIDKKVVVDAIFQGAGTPATNPIPSIVWSYHDKLADYPFDPARARKLLAEAGLADGFETDIWAMPVARYYNPNAKRMAEMIQNYWAAIGVKAKIVTMEWAEYLRRGRAGEHQTYLLGWGGDTGDPDNFLYEVLGCGAVKSGGNRARWCNQTYEDLVVKARKTADRAERANLYLKAQEVFHEEAPWVTLAHSIVFVPMRREVEGYKVDPLGANTFYTVDIK
ncbi:MAG: ABC transporter substrate-binding protein [Alphaproteobacteria bacterium]|nr:ABC transporter substrate-binding protein [Alphaproteobacteria bacterium]